jgi:hypothetical protein
MARYFGTFMWQVFLAHSLGGFSQAIKSKLLSKEEKEKEMYNQ